MKNVKQDPYSSGADTGSTLLSDIDAPVAMNEICSLLRRAADVLEAAMAAIPATLTPQPLPITHPARTTPQYVPSDWPRLLPRDQDPVASTIFDTAAFKEKYRPGISVEIYFGAGEAYKRISRTICLPFYKVGVTKLNGIKWRFAAHKKEKYASFWCQSGTYVEDADFDDQFPSYIRTEMVLSANSPVRATRNSIVVTLPAGMSQLDFERDFRAAIAHCAVHTYLQSQEGQRHCRLIAVDPQIGLRMTAYGFGAGRRMSPADEIYTIRPNRDGDAMLTVVEHIILRRLGLMD